jgi:Fe2+ or Zn2+ uptake regulation protein
MAVPSGGNRHVTADALYEQAISMKLPVSLATVYNTLPTWAWESSLGM